MKSKLSARQAEFCIQYLVDLNGKQAAIRSGYSEATAESQASRLLTSVKVQKRLTQLQTKARELTDISKNEVLTVLGSIIRSDVTDLFLDGKIKPFNQLTPQQRKAVESIKITNSGIEIKLSSKLGAIEKINRMLGYDAPTDLTILEKLDESSIDAIINRLIQKNEN
jgi:phage terminase small subunit